MSVMAARPPNMPAHVGGGVAKRPRLSLQIKTSSSCGSSSSTPTTTTTNRPASRGFSLNPSDPTAFNTLSNAYVTAIERASTPVASPMAEPLTAISTFQAFSLCSPVRGGARPASAYPATPLSAHASSPKKSLVLQLPSVMSPTPPLSAGAVENSGNSKIFSFSPRDAAAGRHSLEQALLYAAASVTATTPASPVATPPKRRTVATPSRTGLSGSPPPYTRAKALRSILRNSPLPSRRPATSSSSAPSPRRLAPSTVRIHEDDTHRLQRAAKRVCYHSPIEQEITTNTYTKSHIDLLVEEATSTTPTTPTTPTTSSPRTPLPVDLSRAFSANEIQDGGQTPGPFADETRRLGAALGASPGLKSATARGEKKRRWVWTIGRDEDADEDEAQLGGAVVAAARAAAAAAAAGGVTTQAPAAPMLSMPKPKRKLDTITTTAEDVEMS